MSLNKKNCLGLGFLRQIFVNTPSPTNTRPGTAKGCDSTQLVKHMTFFTVNKRFNNN